METPTYLILISIFIVLSIWFLIVKYFLNPLFFKPKLNTHEINKFLVQKECLLIEYKSLNKTERQSNLFNQDKGLTFENIISVKSEFKVIGYLQNEKKYKIYWIEIQSKLFPFRNRVFNFIEEKNAEVLDKLQKEYYQEIVPLVDKCPACGGRILDIENECKDCGLNLVAS